MNFKQFLLFIGVSLLLHLILLLLAFSSMLAAWLGPVFGFSGMEDTFQGNQEMTLTVMSQPSGDKKIVDTAQSIPTDAPLENTPFEGDRNTLASSSSPGQGNPFVPNIQGRDIPSQDLYNQRYSPTAAQSVPAPPVRPQLPKPDADKPDKPADKTEPEKMTRNQMSVRPNGQLRANDRSTSTGSRSAQQAAEPSPPASFSTSRIAGKMPGGAPSGDAASIGVKETEEGRYKVKLYRAIGSRWYQYVHMDTGLLNIGSVKIKFYVKSDGTISDLQVTSGRDNTALEAISRRSIMEVSGQLEPFSASMKEKMGDGFWDDVNFSIY